MLKVLDFNSTVEAKQGFSAIVNGLNKLWMQRKSLLPRFIISGGCNSPYRRRLLLFQGAAAVRRQLRQQEGRSTRNGYGTEKRKKNGAASFFRLEALQFLKIRNTSMMEYFNFCNQGPKIRNSVILMI
ncbi:hypothetical protein WN51_03875 [Melipona quadrifasciata]|uniref:Uncharacterized protein n=1 Tax=Melipona quadrifasciata TaxID=166423 RepID=A0A0M9AD43_9HYME|nr:hypothetical protein WN51_03875 [Melipona quadrifasciata]